MEGRKNRKKIIAISIISIVVILAIISVVVFVLLNSQKLKLYNTTLELGQENYIEVLTKEDNVYIKEGYTYSVKDNKIDINKVGSYEITFEIKGKGETIEEIKKIRVQDTTPPTVELKKDTFFIGDSINLEEIVSIKDLSQAEEIRYSDAKAQVEGQFETNKEGESTVSITVEDKNGNKATQELKISVTNPIVSKYEYIKNKLKESKVFSLSETDNKVAIKFADNLSKGWINYTDKVAYETYTYSGSYLSLSSADIMYFDDAYNVYKAEIYSSYDFNDSVMNWYLSKTPKQTITSNDSDISLYQIKTDIDRINNILNDKNDKLQLIGKTIEQIKNETIDLREMQ